jgi:alpha-tubulin suppressor-like RCC1 family protein
MRNRTAAWLRIGLAAAGLIALAPTGARAGRLDALSVGDANTCAVTLTMRLWCWGRNNAGQLGDGTTVEQHAPELLNGGLPGLGPIAMVSTQDDETCILQPSSQITLCAGANGFGQIGDGTNLERHTFTTAHTPPGHNNSVNFLAAGSTPCESDSGGVSCWGSNQLGAVGDGTTIDRSTPVPLPLTAWWAQVSGGDGHACAVAAPSRSDRDGALWCWGSNVDDALGVGPAIGAQSSTPVEVTALGAVFNSPTAVGVGVHHSCAIKADGTLWCWGRNDNGQLGDGTTTSQSTPVQVTALGAEVNGVSVSASGAFTCATVTEGRTMYCWGRNDYGQLGDGTTTERHTPVRVLVRGYSREIGAGRDHACSWQGDETLWCWGRNDHGQIGDGTTTERHTPTFIVLATQAKLAPSSTTWTTLLLAAILVALAAVLLARRPIAKPKAARA